MLTPMMFISAAILVVALIAPLYLVYRRRVAQKPVKGALFIQIGCYFTTAVALSVVGMSSAMAADPVSTVAAVSSGITDKGLGLIAAALATSVSGIGGGIAVAGAASAALGAISENEKMFGKALIFVGLAEGVALYGLIVTFMILSRI